MFKKGTKTKCCSSVSYLIKLFFSKIVSFSRLKIYALDFDIESVTVKRFRNTVDLNDWLEINDNEEKLYGTRAPYTLLFDDVIDASLNFKTNLANTKRSYNGFLLYFIGKMI
jgi:hypothetical protein